MARTVGETLSMEVQAPSLEPNLSKERISHIFRLALQITDLLEEHHVNRRELCYLREQTEMIVRARGL